MIDTCINGLTVLRCTLPDLIPSHGGDVPILASALSGRIGSFSRKAWSRILPDERDCTREESLDWCRRRAEDCGDWASSRRADLWDQAQQFSATLSEAARLSNSPPWYVGGGGATAFLHFLTLWQRPQNVVETGVAAGWSSAAFLAAMEQNGGGDLYSSDLPYFGRPGAGAVIGLMVPHGLRDRWHLYTDGDRANLPRILRRQPVFDIAHYDSDKTYVGRSYFCSCFSGRQIDRTIWLFDDIEDNLHFRDWVAERRLVSHVFHYDGKYLGLAVSAERYAALRA